MAYKVAMTKDQFIKKLKNIVENCPTKYQNWYPYNLGYYHKEGYWSFDCWNLPKSVIWGWEPEKKVGYYVYKPGTYGLGDWNGWTILQTCTNKSSDFKKITAGAFLLTKAADHAGIYVGDFSYKGKTYNVVECTPIWANGVQYTYVDTNGRRLNCKGGSQGGAWGYHGLLPFIDYTEATPTPTPTSNIEVGDKVEVVNAITYNGQPFWCYYDNYTVIELKGDRAVIGVNGVITAAVNVKDLKKISAPQAVNTKIAVGDTVKVKKAITYTGAKFYCYYPSYTVMELVGDRAVIGVNGVITAAINVKNLEKI